MIHRNYIIPRTEPTKPYKLVSTTNEAFSFTCPYCKIIVEHPPPGQLFTCGNTGCKKKRKQEVDKKRRAK